VRTEAYASLLSKEGKKPKTVSEDKAQKPEQSSVEAKKAAESKPKKTIWPCLEAWYLVQNTCKLQAKIFFPMQAGNAVWETGEPIIFTLGLAKTDGK
jgi:hypothetical protein